MQKSRAGLFLMELTIALLFFAFAAAVCIQLFVRAHNLNEESDRLGRAHMIATEIAEVYRAGGLVTIVPEILDDEGHYRDGSYTLYYDASGQLTSASSAGGYEVSLLLAEGNLDIDVRDQYKLSVYKYFPESTDTSEVTG